MARRRAPGLPPPFSAALARGRAPVFPCLFLVCTVQFRKLHDVGLADLFQPEHRQGIYGESVRQSCAFSTDRISSGCSRWLRRWTYRTRSALKLGSLTGSTG